MGIITFPTPSVFPNITPFSQETNPSIQVINTYQTVFSILGSGVLSRATFTTGGGYTATMRVTIDGSVVFLGSSALTNNVYGLEQEGNISYSSSSTRMCSRLPNSGLLGGIPNEVRSYPYIAGGIGLCILDQPISFKSSVLIEIESASLATAPSLSIEGGTM